MLDENPENYKLLLEAEIESLVERSSEVSKLKEALRYSLLPGGKRLRPILSMTFNAELGGDPKRFVSIAALIEVLHCSSLIHDDLPGVDNDDYRRGRPSCHKAFGEASAIFAGDFLISYAAANVARSSYDDVTKNLITLELMNAFCEVCNGQQLDMLEGSERPSLYEIDRRKTGALFSATLAIAALAEKCPTDLINASRAVGLQLGICFQLMDDYIDVFGNDAQRGRPASSDKKSGKQTFFSGRSVKEGKEQWGRAREELERELAKLCLADKKFPLTKAYIAKLLARGEVTSL